MCEVATIRTRGDYDETRHVIYFYHSSRLEIIRFCSIYTCRWIKDYKIKFWLPTCALRIGIGNKLWWLTVSTQSAAVICCNCMDGWSLPSSWHSCLRLDYTEAPWGTTSHTKVIKHVIFDLEFFVWRLFLAGAQPSQLNKSTKFKWTLTIPHVLDSYMKDVRTVLNRALISIASATIMFENKVICNEIKENIFFPNKLKEIWNTYIQYLED